MNTCSKGHLGPITFFGNENSTCIHCGTENTIWVESENDLICGDCNKLQGAKVYYQHKDVTAKWVDEVARTNTEENYSYLRLALPDGTYVVYYAGKRWGDKKPFDRAVMDNLVREGYFTLDPALARMVPPVK